MVSIEALAEILGEVIDELAIRRTLCGEDYEERCSPARCEDYWTCNEIRQRCARMDTLRKKLENGMEEGHD
jgi:hypothetical protein